jgi:hypothetical protein
LLKPRAEEEEVPNVNKAIDAQLRKEELKSDEGRRAKK